MYHTTEEIAAHWHIHMAARAYFITCLLYFGSLGPIPLNPGRNLIQFAGINAENRRI